MKARLRDLGDSFPLKLHPEIGHRWNKTLSIKYSDTTHRHLQTVPTSVVDWQIQNCIAMLTAHHTVRDSFSRKGKKEEGPGGRGGQIFPAIQDRRHSNRLPNKQRGHNFKRKIAMFQK